MPKYRIITSEFTRYEYIVEADDKEDMWEKFYEAQENSLGKELDHDCDVEDIIEE